MAATEYRWRSADGAWETLASWDDGTNFPGETVANPAVDTAIFDGVSQVSVSGDLDQSGNNPLLRGITMPAYRGNWGSSGSPLILATDSSGVGTSRIIHRGSGVLYIQGPVGAITDVYVDSAHSYDSDCMVLDGTIRKIVVRQGRVRVLGSANLSQIHCIGLYAVVIMETDDGGTDPSLIYAREGGVSCDRDLQGATTVVIGKEGAFQMNGRLGDTAVVMNDGTFQLFPSSAPTSSYNPSLYSNGTVDQSKAVYLTSFSDLILGPDSQVLGGALDTTGGLSSLGTELDAREEFP